MSEENPLAEMLLPEEPIAAVKIRGYDWPLYPLTIEDIVEGKLFELMKVAQENRFTLEQMGEQEWGLLSHTLWVLMRKGAPGMTKEAALKGEWNTTAATLSRVCPFKLGDEALFVAVFREFGLSSEGEVVNPLPESPSQDQGGGSAEE